MWLLRWALMATVFAVASCGGDGENSAREQTIAFADAGPLTRSIEGGAFTNIASGGPGTGAISYETSNAAVATVDSSTGTVTPVAVGTVQITASKAADGDYLAATATYSLTLTAPDHVSFAAAVGPSNTLVAFPPWATGLQFLRSSQMDCDPAGLAACADSEQVELAGTAVTDTAVNLSRQGLWWLQRNGVTSPAAVVSASKFQPRVSAAAVSFDGRLWVIGGTTDAFSTSGMKNDVWSSTDGESWTHVTANAGFSRRADFALAVFNGRMWVIGGIGVIGGGSVYLQDIWSSEDGINWTLEVADPAFGPGRDYLAVTFNGRLWLYGGFADSHTGVPQGIWSSSNGVDWDFEAVAPWNVNFDLTVTQLNDRLYAVGGVSPYKVWSSADGVNWTIVRDGNGEHARVLHAAGVLNGRLYIAGGNRVDPGRRVNSVYSSDDGWNWIEEENTHPYFSPRTEMAYAVHEGRLFLIGGTNFGTPATLPNAEQYFYNNEVWSTSGNGTWRLHTAEVPVMGGSPNAAVLGNRLWLVGGFNGVQPYTMMSSTDGKGWVAPTAPIAYPARTAPGVTAHNGRLWIVGGRNFPVGVEPFWLRDVWNSPDGEKWTLATASAEFRGREGASLLSFNNQLMLIGGYDDSGVFNDVWTSSDGVLWTRITPDAGFPARMQAGATVFNGRVWIVGGTGAGGPLADIWSSADGVNWRQETASAPGLPGHGASLAAHDGRLWMTGGYTHPEGPRPPKTHSNKVWSSTDGIVWTEEPAGARYSPRSHAAFTSFDGRLWVIGGFNTSPLSDAWWSVDGITWRQQVTGRIPYP